MEKGGDARISGQDVTQHMQNQEQYIDDSEKECLNLVVDIIVAIVFREALKQKGTFMDQP